jgi:hypothetical protein
VTGDRTDSGHWVVLVTDGTIIEYPPELYESRERARVEAGRWAWILSDYGQFPIRQPFDNRWEAGIRDIRLVDVGVPKASNRHPWIGTFWTTDGYPDPEAVLLEGRDDAMAWAKEPLIGGLSPTAFTETTWSLAATFVIRGEESYAVAHMAKIVR